ncbi:flagellar biosynthesis protein FlhF [Helicobacter mustelae]|uniref:Flagellar biosynthesis protein FlhF n=1 Tax=Helicobacter mustelae (strain ATCC 43772 / CCUG 25715 / CIP 103759 / LMG 18044 / NCTC 12198 / R85-136P) TaxID=679897 RepID=D3UJ60_HELM1|nr:flagellar biosynthesis protein FlhF [Helicobacter mustelae]CBG40535.1 flagellar biosynthesis protein [Helicobacter mustelae 12198]SQH72033.1 flagellar biosynthesis protein [Helicobacter mustelae]
MKLYTYGGETAAEALKIVQSKHGEDALIIKTNEVRKKTLTQPGLYEIVVAVDEAKASSPSLQKNSVQNRLDTISKKKMQKSYFPELDSPDDAASLELSETVQQIHEIQAKKHPPKKENFDFLFENKMYQKEERLKKEQQEEAKEFKAIKAELDKLNDRIKLIQNMVWEEKCPTNLQIPQEFAEIYRIAKNSGIYQVHLDEIMKLSLELMPLKMRENSVTIKRYFREILRKMLYCRNENLDMSSKKIIMLIGPTGVGKTTTLAKLAARYSRLLDHKYRVGIITLDTYRIGALDQLTWYARKMKISIETVIEPEDFLREIDALRYCDVILVDTAGHSQHDKQKIQQLRRFVQNDYKIDVSLVLSATTKFGDLKDIYHAFSDLGVDSFVFSKLDESRGLGNLFSLAYETKKPISYLSIGQEVPTDLCVATNDYLADCLLDGFYNPNKGKK